MSCSGPGNAWAMQCPALGLAMLGQRNVPQWGSNMTISKKNTFLENNDYDDQVKV